MSNSPSNGRNGSHAWIYGFGLGGLLVVLVATAAWFNPFSGGADAVPHPTFTVEEGPLTISVTESGTIQARDQEILQSRAEGQNTIIYLIDEGAMVEEGDLLVELDASGFEEQRAEQEITVQNADSDLTRAREQLEVTRSQAESDVDQAELELRFARLDLRKYIGENIEEYEEFLSASQIEKIEELLEIGSLAELDNPGSGRSGEYRKQLDELERQVTLAEEELERARDRVEGSRELHDQAYIAESELLSDELSMRRAELDYDLAVAELELFQNYTRERDLEQLISDVEQARASLDRTERRARSDVIQAEAELNAAELAFNQQTTRLERIERNIENCRIEAPTDGMVIYATSAQSSRRGNQEPLDEGQQVRERQELIYLPTAGRMRAEIKIHESALSMVEEGQRARVQVEGTTDYYWGRVSRIAPLPDAQSVWMNPDLTVYNTEVTLDREAPELRSGRSCRVEIIVDHYDSAVYVPVQSVVRVNGQPTVYVPGDGGELIARSVELGLDNNRMVKVDEGLSPGERVVLTPPLSDSVVLARGPEVEADPVSDSDGGAMSAEEAASAVGEADNDEGGEPSAEPASEGFPDPGEMSQEQRERMRERLENMSDEEREQMRQRFQQMQGGGDE